MRRKKKKKRENLFFQLIYSPLSLLILLPCFLVVISLIQIPINVLYFHFPTKINDFRHK